MLPKWSEEFGQVSGVYSECFIPLLYVFREKYKGLQSGMKQQRLSQVYFETASYDLIFLLDYSLLLNSRKDMVLNCLLYR